MKKVTCKFLSLVLAVIMVASLAVPMSVVSASAAEGDEAASATVYMTISDQGVIAKDKDGAAMAWREVTATDIDGDGTVTFDEAIKAAHKTYCAAGTDGYDVSSSGWVNKLWGETGSFSFIKNNVAEMDVVTDTAVEDNDYLVASVNQDNSLYSDWNSYFDKYEATVSTGETVTLNLSGYLAMTINEPKAAEGVQIGVWEDGAFKAIDGAVTDASGNVDVSFDEPGTYIVTASGTAADTVDAAGLYVLMESAKDKDDKTIYGKMDWTTSESWVGYTEKDYGEGPYPWNEIQWMPLFSEDDEVETFDAETFDAGYLLYSGNVLNDCPLIVPCCIVTVEDKVELADGTYNATGLSTAVLSMYHFHDPQVVIKGDEAWLITTEDTDNTVKRFDGMAYGKQSEILDPSDETNHTLVEGTVTANVVPKYKEDGTLETRTFVLPVPKSVIEAGEDIYYMIKYVDGYSDTHDGDWYKASGGDYYLTGYTLEYVSDSTVLPGDPEIIDLEITNNTGMFKAVSAHVEKTDDATELVMALSGSGYKELFKGTYEAAVANGDGTADKGNDTWIHGYTNDDGKLEFRIPIEEGETYVPCVAVSNSYYTKYLGGENTLARAFYPRQFELDFEAKTLVTGDYEYSQDLTITNNVKMFKVDSAKLETVGGPNSNNYKANLALTMGSDSFSKAFVGTAEEAVAAEKVIEIGEGRLFEIPVKWVETFGQPETMKTLIGEPFTMSFFSVKNERWYERIFTISETDGTLVIDALADYTAVDAAIAKVPEDLSVYTDESAKAVTDAVAAVTRGLTSDKQAEVDAMAQAIEDAVAALECREHTWDQGTVTTEATYLKEGVMTYTCTVCGETRSEIIPKKTATSKWIKEDGEWYYFDANSEILTNGWTKDSTGWCWMGADGKITKNKWIQDKGEWYYLKANGYMAANEWAKDSKGWMYMGANGKITKNKWIQSGGQWYYLKANGYMAANEWAKDSKGWMYMDASGKITKNKWIKYNGYWYYLKSNGYMAANEYASDSTKTYWMGSDGRIAS